MRDELLSVPYDSHTIHRIYSAYVICMIGILNFEDTSHYKTLNPEIDESCLTTHISHLILNSDPVPDAAPARGGRRAGARKSTVARTSGTAGLRRAEY